ncbi:MAG: DUF805 domain-containing protein [Fibromonadaceae bacterium]|jgi:uncharacterized membrane protein YhaH (DUF805 family)|nr:DUF805 domain-containing protein [Fibromonadaceae bacterium]
MPFCSKCGTEVSEEVKFCSKCGNDLQAASSASSDSEQAGNLSLWEYYIKVIKNYVNFKGRARRKEYWGFFLFNFIIGIALAFFGGVISGIAGDDEGTLGVVLYYLYIFATALPGIAVLIRRLHDTGKSGWLWLLAFIPIVGVIIILIWTCTNSQSGENKYGPNPKGV